ncbi:MAG TPA: hypothetical protein VGI30_13965 [Caulobacteraceae bacterium]
MSTRVFRLIPLVAAAALLLAAGETGRDGCTWTRQPDGSRGAVCVNNGRAYCLICPTPGICSRVTCPG